MSLLPAAFLSYIHQDDQHEAGRLSTFCERLAGEVRMQTGDQFHIFQDRKDIAWGQQWQQRITDSLDTVTFLIPIITPGYFKSQACRGELEHFLEREKSLTRNDLILPVYYVNCPLLNDEAKRKSDPLAETIANRQYIDWQHLRFESFTSPEVCKTFEKMALQIKVALERNQSLQPIVTSVVSEPIDEQITKIFDEIRSKTKTAITQSVKVARDPFQRTEPPTRVVDALHRGDHVTLSEALKVANPGDRILIRPGTYNEGIVIDKPIEIIGDGELNDVVIESVGKHTIQFTANMGRIANLTLRQVGGENWYCVDIAQGHLELEGCDISSQSLACVAIHGGADPRLRRNQIHDGKTSGVFVFENSHGTLEDNNIFGNEYSGVEITDGSNPTLRRNCIFNGKACGVYIHDNGLGMLEDNDIYGNLYSGVEIRMGSNPILRRNRIHNGKAGGVYINEYSLSKLEDNDIFENEHSAVAIKTGSNPVIKNNCIHNGKRTGIYVYDNGLGIIEDNHIFSNAYSGLKIKTNGNPTVRRNRILKNGYEAVWVIQGGQGIFEDNNLRENAKGAWRIAPECLEKVKRERNLE